VRLEEAPSTGTNRRWTVFLEDGSAVEAVLYHGVSLCISSQVGCAVACPFCASGANGLKRALSLEELTGQVSAVQGLGHPVKRVTVSGVGEPLHNRSTLDLIAWCRDQRIAPSVTTSGGPVARLRELIRAHHNGVTVSVHAGTEPTRSLAVPHGPALDPLFETLADEVPRLSRSRQRKIALAFLMIADLNDRDEELDAFARRAEPLGIWTHLYAFNPVPTSAHQPVPRERYEHAYRRLTEAGLRVRMSSKARVESNGGCGTLVALGASRR